MVSKREKCKVEFISSGEIKLNTTFVGCTSSSWEYIPPRYARQGENQFFSWGETGILRENKLSGKIAYVENYTEFNSR